ncbi:DUF6809 family protein [Ruthenibacterium lactatiformans]|uniref:DUF6809 family protein n=1 Tax=Ruthenibacterium lactatiformans TaxID=1550024 RepID=UPI0034676F23
MENKLLKELYDCFYIRPELDEQENEVEKCRKALIAALEKPERRLVLRIIDAQDSIREQTSLDSFMAGFELAWRLSAELHNDENERSFSCRTRRTGARFSSEGEPE